MASPLVAKAVRCTECFRHLFGSLGSPVPGPFRQQLRGKKKLARVVTINVHLLQNIPGYGRRGAVIPVTPGVMRNIWYPKKMAEYATAAKLQELGVKRDAAIERDGAFATNRQRKLEKAQEPKESRSAAQTGVGKPPAEEVILELEQLSSQEATVLLESLLPASVDFYRTPIAASQPTKRVSPSIPTTSTVSSAATARQTPEKTSIYGSVSTSDIVANLKAILAENENGARVPLAAEDICFVETLEDNQRIKHLGVYEIEIRLKGAPDAVRRTIKVNAQE